MSELATLVTSALVSELEQLCDQVTEAVAPLSEAQIWTKPVRPGNSIGHLLLHLAGNLNHYVGAQLGGTGYVRDREREFTESSRPPKQDLLASLSDAVATFHQVVTELDAESLGRPHPESRFGSHLNALIRLVSHFALHRGQISYLTRLVSSPATSAS